MENLILSDLTGFFVSLGLFAITNTVVFIIIGTVSEKKMDEIFEKEIQDRINSLEHHRLKD